MTLARACSKIIEYSFYALFFLTPLAFTDKTSELFEFNKMWLIFGLTIIIGTSWITKMILQKEIRIQRTPLDIPILLFLISQFISTVVSLDTHVSIWGYYSRFNGGLLSIISYIFLYYAFISNLSHLGNLLIKRILLVSLISGAIVALWGLPSHFGYDPTCFIFRGTLDVTCWTEAFQPKIRIFSTLGQPNWMAAYLAILLPIAIAFAIQKTQSFRKSESLKFRKSDYLTFRVIRVFWKEIIYVLTVVIFYLDLLFTGSNSGFLGFTGGIILFFAIFVLLSTKSIVLKLTTIFSGSIFFLLWMATKWKDLKIISFLSLIFLLIYILQIIYVSIKSKENILAKNRLFLSLFFIPILIISLFLGTPASPSIKNLLPKPEAKPQAVSLIKESQTIGPALEVGGTDSGKIRLIVWRGALDIWRNNPFFGTGVETYAFAYYKYRPASHNLTSEWDYLYNKAHNEYLNYLATTGAFGLGSYLLMIGVFLFLTLKKLIFSENSDSSENQKLRQSDNLIIRKSGTPSFPSVLIITLLASYVSILVSNFFGFSVVIINLYMFMIPAFVLILNNQIKYNYSSSEVTPKGGRVEKHQSGNSSRLRSNNNQLSGFQWFGIISINLISLYLILNLFRSWQADTDYAMGNNLDKIGQYQEAYPKLHEAVSKRGDEPTFKDELSFNNAVLALALLNQKDTNASNSAKETAARLIQEAIETSNNVVSEHPNNIVSWKTRIRMFYMLSQINQQYLNFALEAIIKASTLAPTDAKISYNLGVLYGQSGNNAKAIETLQKTIILKPDYRDAYYALGLFYYEAAVDKNQKIIKPELQKKAVETMNYILDNFSSNDGQAKQALEKWGEK